MDFIYSSLSLGVTGLGFLFLGILTMSELQTPSNFTERTHTLGLKWATFIGFISIQPILLQIMFIIPFGNILVLIIKICLIVPENRVTGWVSEKVRKIGTRLVEKNSSAGKIVREVAVFGSVLMLTVSRYVIKAAGVGDVAVVKRSIKKCHKLIEVHEEIPKKEQRDEKESNIKEQAQIPVQKPQSPKISRIKVYQLSLKSKKFERAGQIQIQYKPESNTIIFHKNEGTKQRTLKEIKYISNDLLELQLVVHRQNQAEPVSYPIQLAEEWQIEKWMTPVIQSLKSYK